MSNSSEMIHYWMTCGQAKPVIVGVENDVVWLIGKPTAFGFKRFIGCTFERIPDHHPASIDYPAILQNQAV